MNTDAILNDLFSRQNRGIKPGLERTFSALKRLGDPQDRCAVVHVAGTNGKGSTSTMIAAVLHQAGFRTGLFTSPHILEFRERFIIDGIPVADEKWLAVWNDIQPLCDELELTFFEISTIIAFKLFAREKCDHIVLETGMGGRLDSTNVCDPILSVVTAISLEHTEYLGDTIEKIAVEKLGIVKPNRPLVIQGENPEEVLDLARLRCESTGSELTISNSSQFARLSDSVQGQVLSYGANELFVPLLGDFQIQNVACAVTACEKLGIDEQIIREGIAKAFIPCRLQWMTIRGKTWLFDVAHNPQAIAILCESLTQKVHFLTGMMKDKEYDLMLKTMIPHSESITLVQPSIPRAARAEDLGEIIRNEAPNCLFDVADSVEHGVKLCAEHEGIHVVTGSFYTIADVFTALGCSPWNR